MILHVASLAKLAEGFTASAGFLTLEHEEIASFSSTVHIYPVWVNTTKQESTKQAFLI